jgi:Flp pilus assembly protein TadD
MEGKPPQFCPEGEISALTDSMRTAAGHGTDRLDALLLKYPKDARLHFLKGSLLAGSQDYAGARAAMRRAVDIAPDYAVARFQLGLLLLSSGEPHAAQEAWGPLHGLPQDHYLRIFVTGLGHLIRDEFVDAVRVLTDGIARNRDNLPMNGDMQRIIDEVRSRSGDKTDGAAMSSVGFLLQQSALKDKLH